MPSKQTIDKAKQDLAEGKRPSTAAGEFVREEMEHIREGRHGAANTKQAIAIGLSKARRSGVPLPPPGEGQASPQTRRSARRDAAAGRRPQRGPRARSQAARKSASTRRARAR